MSVAILDTKDYLDCNKAADALGLSPDSIRVYLNNAKMEKTPALHGTQIGRDWLIPKSEIARYKKERQGRGRPKADG